MVMECFGINVKILFIKGFGKWDNFLVEVVYRIILKRMSNGLDMKGNLNLTVKYIILRELLEFHGDGILYLRNGDKFIGKFVNNLPEGYGKLI